MYKGEFPLSPGKHEPASSSENWHGHALNDGCGVSNPPDIGTNVLNLWRFSRQATLDIKSFVALEESKRKVRHTFEENDLVKMNR